MTPYADFLYFGLAGLYVLLPVVLARGFLPRVPAGLRQAWTLSATALMLAVQYSGGFEKTPSIPRQIWALGAFAVAQYVLAAALLVCRRRTKARWPGWLAVLLAVTPLLVAKFLPVNAPVAGSAAMSAGTVGAAGLVEFLGLSYATLRAVDVLIGIHDGLIVSLTPGKFFAFLLFFPTVSSGPIDRYRRFSAEWVKPDDRPTFWQDLDAGVHRIFTGFLYKFVFAYLISLHWMTQVPATPTLGHTVSYMYAYSFYLFFDFAGYSAFAVGFAYLLGYRVPENFNLPFISRNIKEFWTRWHISLSFWFRDYIYMRFLLLAIKKKWFRSKHTPAYLANFLTFGVMGFWHGTAAHYLVYGAYHACIITGHDLFVRWNRPKPDAPARLWGDSLPWQLAGIVCTFQAVCFGFLIFSGRRFW